MSKYTEAQREAVIATYSAIRAEVTNKEAVAAVVAEHDFVANTNSARGLLTSKLANGVYKPDEVAKTSKGEKRDTKAQVAKRISSATGLALPSLEKANMAELKALEAWATSVTSAE